MRKHASFFEKILGLPVAASGQHCLVTFPNSSRPLLVSPAGLGPEHSALWSTILPQMEGRPEIERKEQDGSLFLWLYHHGWLFGGQSASD